MHLLAPRYFFIYVKSLWGKSPR